MSMTAPMRAAATAPPGADPGLEASDAGAALMHVQAQFESERGALVRVLHDDLGGLLVGAAMDIGWLSQQPQLSPAVGDKLARVSALLRAAIDLKRTLIEEIQPSLLHNVGLLAALRWQIKRTCDAAGVVYEETYPAEEPPLSSATKVTLFRLVQECLDHLLVDGGVGPLFIDIRPAGSELHCSIISEQPHDPSDRTRAAETVFNTSMHFRALSAGGRFKFTTEPAQRHIDICIPLSA